MTEEQNLEVRKEDECKCFCKSKGFRKFIIVSLGTFVGVFCALSLFAALHKPPMPPCGCHHRMMRPPIEQMEHFDRGQRGDFQKQIPDHRIGKRTPFEPQTDRVETR